MSSPLYEDYFTLILVVARALPILVVVMTTAAMVTLFVVMMSAAAVAPFVVVMPATAVAPFVVVMVMSVRIGFQFIRRRITNLRHFAHKMESLTGKGMVEVHIYTFFPYVDDFSLYLLTVIGEHRQYRTGVYHFFVKNAVDEERLFGKSHL